MPWCIAVLLSFSFVLFATQPVPAATTQQEAAIAWLKLVDNGDYAQSWQTGSHLFRTAVAETNWTTSLQAVRAPLGALVRRSLTTSQQASSLPGAPDGEYCILSFTTEFAHKKAATETLTFMREADAQWRAAGYFIK